MEFLIGFIYEVIGIRAVKKQKGFVRKMMLILGFLTLGFLLLIVLLSI